MIKTVPHPHSFVLNSAIESLKVLVWDALRTWGPSCQLQFQKTWWSKLNFQELWWCKCSKTENPMPSVLYSDVKCLHNLTVIFFLNDDIESGWMYHIMLGAVLIVQSGPAIIARTTSKQTKENRVLRKSVIKSPSTQRGWGGWNSTSENCLLLGTFKMSGQLRKEQIRW